MKKYLKIVGNNKSVSEWKSKGLSDETTSPCDETLTPTVKYYGEKMYAYFDGVDLEQDKITYVHTEIVKIYIVYELDPNFNQFDTTLENCPFGEASVARRSSHFDNYQIRGYSIGFDSRGSFSHPSSRLGENIIIFGVVMASSAYANNRTKTF